MVATICRAGINLGFKIIVKFFSSFRLFKFLSTKTDVVKHESMTQNIWKMNELKHKSPKSQFKFEYKI